jgi:hypothetical protein
MVVSAVFSKWLDIVNLRAIGPLGHGLPLLTTAHTFENKPKIECDKQGGNEQVYRVAWHMIRVPSLRALVTEPGTTCVLRDFFCSLYH